jgi:hypothetical protein
MAAHYQHLTGAIRDDIERHMRIAHCGVILSFGMESGCDLSLTRRPRIIRPSRDVEDAQSELARYGVQARPVI